MVGHLILINGKQRVKIYALGGLRQGGLHSHFLCFLGSGLFKSNYLKEVEGNFLVGFEVGRDRLSSSHLPFADDTS